MDQISNEAVTYRYAYDNQRRMTRKTDSRNGLTLEWAYNEIGRVVSKFDYQNVATKFTYDNTGRLIAMANKDYVQASYHYDAAGRLLSRILSNGAATLYHYDKDGFLTKITQRSSSGVVIDERSYTQDRVGNITQVAITNGETIDYVYDPVYRLKIVTSTDSANNQSYGYDDVGNRKSMTRNGVTTYYEHSDGNRLEELRHGTALVFSYDYDDNGSRINKRNSVGAVVESYAYNQKRLITQMNSAGSVTNFAYDPNLYRIQKSSSVGTNNYLLEAEHLESVFDGNNQLKASYLRGVVVDEIINGFERDANGNWLNRTFHHDQVNSVVALSDHNGVTAQKRAYTPFGLDLSSSGESTNSLAYTGREQDNESGLYYYRARYYDPEVGRFISEDPLGFEAGINFYSYVGNNPLRFNDPMGLDTQVSIGYTQVVGSTNHQFVILTDTVTGEQFATRGGPSAQGFSGSASNSGLSTSGGSLLASSGNGGSGGFGFGQIVATSGTFDSTFGLDFENQHTTQYIGTFNLDYSDAVSNAIEFTNVTNQNNIPYFPTGPNSNSYATTFVESLTGTRPTPAITSPGYSFGSPSPDLSFSPSSASGGFVLYPNHINNNISIAVYSK
ncbi:MAG: RHS repeat-associated core domain-containing protein [Thiotrichaceae bacterium]|nr:RHS repeat-associated core domain-containing protein [Thiotrichaceae bacterium]